MNFEHEWFSVFFFITVLNSSPRCRAADKTNNKSRSIKQQEERKWNQTQSKLQVLLYRQKELLKKEILRKRALLEKELQMQIQVSCRKN